MFHKQFGSGEGNVGLSVGPGWNISTAIGWVTMKFCTDVHGPHRLKLTARLFLLCHDVDGFGFLWTSQRLDEFGSDIHGSLEVNFNDFHFVQRQLVI